MEENEYKDNEKVLYKTRGKVRLPHKKPEEADCLVTEGHVVIEVEVPIKIPLSRIKDCEDWYAPPRYLYYTSPTQAQEPLPSTATLTFLDDLNKKRKLPLEMADEDVKRFKHAIYRQIVGRFIDYVEERPRTTLGKLFSKAKEANRGETRDNICAGLRMLGIDAQMAARGRVEEKVWDASRGGSLGIIYIPEGPIRWVDVRRETDWGMGGGLKAYYYTDYGVPDPRLGPDSPRVYISTVWVKTFPLVGKVVDLRWEGEDSDLGIISRLNSDYRLKQPIMNSPDVTITAIGDYSCWIISTEISEVPLEELWSCYQAIAWHLLAEWSPVQ